MASNIKARPPEDEAPEKPAAETAPDSPLLDLSDAAVKKLIRSAKKRGYVTHDQINSVLHSEEVNSKRIEAGREAMIASLCESPLTFQAIIIWRDELNEGKVLLRDIIDLEATYAG